MRDITNYIRPYSSPRSFSRKTNPDSRDGTFDLYDRRNGGKIMELGSRRSRPYRRASVERDPLHGGGSRQPARHRFTCLHCLWISYSPKGNRCSTALPPPSIVSLFMNLLASYRSPRCSSRCTRKSDRWSWPLQGSRRDNPANAGQARPGIPLRSMRSLRSYSYRLYVTDHNIPVDRLRSAPNGRP